MNLEFLNSASDFLIRLLAILFAISIHEFGHAYVAYLNGDPTAKNYGRMTINPISHIDPVGMLMMFIIHFGWAKPVPVDDRNYKNLKIGNITVSMAGITFNIVSAIVFALLYKYIDNELSRQITYQLIIYNIGFAAFNILPIPPLDGWSLISTFLSRKTVYKTYRYANYTTIIFVILMITGLLGRILTPVYGFMSSIVFFFVNFF